MRMILLYRVQETPISLSIDVVPFMTRSTIIIPVAAPTLVPVDVFRAVVSQVGAGGRFRFV